MKTITLRWVDGQMMVGTDSGNHSVVIGKSSDSDSFQGMKPADLLLMAAASCATWDIIEILQKQREPIQDVKVECSGEQQQDPPWTFTRVHVHYIFKGAVKMEKVEKAIRLSEDKYCSVISTLRLGIPVTSDFEVVE